MEIGMPYALLASLYLASEYSGFKSRYYIANSQFKTEFGNGGFVKAEVLAEENDDAMTKKKSSTWPILSSGRTTGSN
jgi:hypothetical protein